MTARPPAPAPWRGLPALASALLLSMTPWFSATAVIGQLRDLWMLAPAETAWLTIAVQLGFVAGALLSAGTSLADVVEPRRLMLYGSLGAATANALLLISAPGPAIALRMLTGAGLALVYPPALKAMATWFQQRRGTALGVMVGALTLGSAVPHLVNGLGGLDWRVVIAGTSLLAVLGGVVAEFAGADGPYPFPRTRFDPRNIGRVWANRGVRLACAGYFGHMWELYAMWSWFAVFFADTLLLHGHPQPVRMAALATFAVIGVGAVGCLAGGVLGDRWGRTRATALAMVVSGACAVLIGLARSAPVWLVLVVGLVWGFWVIADSAQFSTVVTEVADPGAVGTALTLQLAVGFTLSVTTIWLIPVLVEAVTWRWAFAVLALGPGMGTAAMLRLLRSQDAVKLAGGRG